MPTVLAPSTAATGARAASGWKQVSAGYNSSCAIYSTGRLYCEGNNYYGQLGDGPRPDG